MTYAQRHLDATEAAAYREKHSRTWTRRLSHWREMRCVRAAVDRALRELGDAPTILDLPCGAGRLAGLLAARSGRYVPADHSPHMLDLTREELARHGLADRAPATVQTDARRIPLGTGSVDLAVCLRLVHHFPDRADLHAILAELARVSRGPVIVSYLDADSWKQRRKRARAARGGPPGNRAALTATEFASEAGRVGLSVAAQWRLSTWFSGLCIALLTRPPAQ